MIDDQSLELVAIGDVAIEGHRLHPELVCQETHRQALETALVHERERGLGNFLWGQGAGAGHGLDSVHHTLKMSRKRMVYSYETPANRAARQSLSPGDPVRRRTLVDVTGHELSLPPRDGLVHLQFRRFAGCPVCDLHLRTFERRAGEIASAGVRGVVVFHSDRETLLNYGADRLPFSVVADPEKALYVEFGVEAAPRALLDPRAWLHILIAVLSYLWLVVRRRRLLPPKRAQGGRLGLPADFLVTSDGVVVASHYGEHAYDQWSVDTLLGLVRGISGARA